jgi:hypothetical protein
VSLRNPSPARKRAANYPILPFFGHFSLHRFGLLGFPAAIVSFSELFPEFPHFCFGLKIFLRLFFLGPLLWSLGEPPIPANARISAGHSGIPPQAYFCKYYGCFNFPTGITPPGLTYFFVYCNFGETANPGLFRGLPFTISAQFLHPQFGGHRFVRTR